MLISTKHLLAKHKVLPAFNFGTLEVARSIVEAAQSLDAPFIFEVNQKEVEFIGFGTAVSLITSLSHDYSVPFSLHLDHTSSTKEFRHAVELGFTSGLFDVSKLPVTEALKVLHDLKETLPPDFMLEVTCDSVENSLRMEELGASLLAVEKDNYSDLDLMGQVRKFTKLPFVMHGGSSRTVSDVRKAIELGVVKVNFNTCLRQAWRLGLENSFKENPHVLQSYVLLAKSRDLVREVAKEKIQLVRRAAG